MDVYTPTGDTETDRPLIVYLHTGSFLPRYINQLPTGSKSDSATVEMCRRFAKKGYVVAAIGYRAGWNPASPSENTRKQTIIQAVYRSMQDAKTAVRFFRKSIAEESNPYGIRTRRSSSVARVPVVTPCWPMPRCRRPPRSSC
jgi:carboxylesterase type B